MRNDNFIDFGEEISKTVRKVLNHQDFNDLKNTINRTMQNVPGMGRNPFFQEAYKGDDISPLSKEMENDHESYGAFDSRSGRAYQNMTSKAHQNMSKSAHQKINSVGSTLLLVFGFIVAIPTGLLTLIGIATEATVGDIRGVVVAVTISALLFLVSMISIMAGFKMRKRIKRFRLYQKVLDGRLFCMIKELCVASGEGTKFIIKDLRKMIKVGLFSEGYLDEQETCLMLDYKTYALYLETMNNVREQQEAEQIEKEKWENHKGGVALKEAIEEGNQYIRTIKAANDALPEVEISEKLDHLEGVTTKIFDYVERYPEKLPEIRKFMCYYMPITLKLVKAYQKFDQQGADAGEIVNTKLEIKETLDTINKAYHNLLNKLMQADILDVSSDISALETILAQEGLTEDDFIKNETMR